MASRKPPKSLATPTASTRKKGPNAWVLDDAGIRTSLTPQLADECVTRMRRGYWPRIVALLTGVTPTTLHGWIERGVSDDAIEPYRSFAERMLEAEALSSADLFDVLRDGALGLLEGVPVVPARKGPPPRRPADLRVAMWLLQQRYGADWRGAGVSAMAVLEQVEVGYGQKIRAQVDVWLRSLPPQAVAQGRELGFALDEP